MHSLVRRSRDRLLYPNRCLANSSGLWTSHELSGFQTLLDVRESEMGSLEIFSALWIKVLTPSTVLHILARQWKTPLLLFVLGSHSEDRSLPASVLPTPAARRGAGRRSRRRWGTADVCRLVQPCQRSQATSRWRTCTNRALFIPIQECCKNSLNVTDPWLSLNKYSFKVQQQIFVFSKVLVWH